jgi:EpsI family protein
MRFLRSKPAVILTVLLLCQAAVFYGGTRSEHVPQIAPLSELPSQLGGWKSVSDNVIEPEVREVLKADDLLNRTYASPQHGTTANLFVAFFRTQRTGQAPHSPKNCLPGSGWVPSVSDIVSISVPGRSEPISVNRYVVSKGESKSLVMYWYQSRDRIVASEYSAKFFVAADAIRYNRTDTSLVRVVVPIVGEVEAAERAAEAFVRDFFPPLRQRLPA